MRRSNHDTLSDVIVQEERCAYTHSQKISIGAGDIQGVHDVSHSINLTMKTELFVCGKLSLLRQSVWIWLIRTHMSFPFSHTSFLSAQKKKKTNLPTF